MQGEKINSFLSWKVLEDFLDVCTSALGTTTNISTSFIKKVANFIQTDYGSMQLCVDHRNVHTLNLGLTNALKNVEEILKSIVDFVRNAENLI